MAAFELKKPEAAALIREGLAWYAKEGVDVYPNIEREAVRQDGLLLLARIAKANGNEAEETKYHKQFLEALGPDPDRYGTLRASPCFVIYQARPTREKPIRP